MVFIKNRIVVFGGAFNPPLNSHLSIAEEILNQFEDVELVIFVPINESYNKEGLIENKHRYNMLKLVTDKNDNFEVSDIDMRNTTSLFTYEILEIVEKEYSDKEISFVIGSDNLKELDTWKEPEKLLSKYKILVMERDTDDIDEIINNNELLNKYKYNIIKINKEIKSNYSSTYVRNQIKKNKSVRYLLPDEINEYIKENNLYKEEI